MDDIIDKFYDTLFPKGIKDVDAVTNELLFILENKVNIKTARSIIFTTMALSRITAIFDKEKLKEHLEGYAIQYFNEEQIDMLFDYLDSLKFAMLFNQKTPSEVKRLGKAYIW